MFHYDKATNKASNNKLQVKIPLPFSLCQGRINGLTGQMDFRAEGSNSHVQFEILGTSYSETFGKDVKRVSAGPSQDTLFTSARGLKEMKHCSEKNTKKKSRKKKTRCYEQLNYLQNLKDIKSIHSFDHT